MRLAVLTDIHANRAAFEAVLADAAARGATRHAILGDIVGYGPDPEWCADRAIELAGQGAICLRGNHDSALSHPESMNALARAAIDWTRPRLSPVQRAFLDGLPLTAREGRVMFTHASANAPQDWIYVTGPGSAMPSFRVTDAGLILCGHIHRPGLYSCDLRGQVRGHPPKIGTPAPLLSSRRWLATVGAVGQPRDGAAQAGYAIWDDARRELSFLRVPYDAAATAARIRAEGLPEALAQRLLKGT